MMDRAPSVHFVQHAPTMNIRTSNTTISRVDPLKKAFRGLFDVLPTHSRGHVVAALGEFIGTIFFLFMAFSSAQVAFIASNRTTNGDINTAITSVTPQELLYIALGAGLSLAVTAWVFFRISGGLFNPVVSIGMVLIGALTWARGITLCIVQTVGAIVAAYMTSALFPGGLKVGTALHPGMGVAQGVIVEMLLTSQLVFTIFMLAAEKHDATFIAPIGIGLSLFIAEMIGVFWTGGSLNPARSLAPAIVTRSFPTEHWIYWVGPMAGTLLAVLIYKLIKALEYETVQSDDEAEKPTLPTSRVAMVPSTVELSTVRIPSRPSSAERDSAKKEAVMQGGAAVKGVKRAETQSNAVVAFPLDDPDNNVSIIPPITTYDKGGNQELYSAESKSDNLQSQEKWQIGSREDTEKFLELQ